MQGTQAFCSGGDQAVRKADGYADYDKFGRLNVLDLQVRTYMGLSSCILAVHYKCHFIKRFGFFFSFSYFVS